MRVTGGERGRVRVHDEIFTCSSSIPLQAYRVYAIYRDIVHESWELFIDTIRYINFIYTNDRRASAREVSRSRQQHEKSWMNGKFAWLFEFAELFFLLSSLFSSPSSSRSLCGCFFFFLWELFSLPTGNFQQRFIVHQRWLEWHVWLSHIYWDLLSALSFSQRENRLEANR